MEPNYMAAIQAALAWAMKDERHRTVKVKFSSDVVIPLSDDTRVSIWCYDHKRKEGVHIKMDWFDLDDPISSIESAINQSVEDKERELLKKLKQKYEPSAV